MKFIKFLLCAYILFCPLAVRADDKIDCAKAKPFETQIEISFLVNEAPQVTEYSLAELGVKRETYFYMKRNPGEDNFWIEDHENMGGYFMAGHGARIDFGIKVLPHPDVPMLACTFIEKIKVEFIYTGTVLLDKNYDLPECAAAKKAAEEFMKERYVMAHGVINAKQLKLHEELPEIISKLEKSPVDSGKKEEKIETIKEIMHKASAQFPKNIQEEIEEKSKALGDDVAIAEAWVSCRLKK